MKSSSEAAALIPAFNEEDNIAEAVTRTKAEIPNVIVVDDGSSDDTARLAKLSGAEVLSHPVNLGKGMALKTGTDYILENLPKVKYVIVIDADLQLNPEEAENVIAPLLSGEADLVMGMRDFSNIPFRHRLGNFVWRAAFNVVFGTRLKDISCGYVALTVPAIRTIGDFHGGYIIETHMLSEALKRGLRISQVPVKVNYKKVSTVPRGIRVFLGVLIFILKTGLAYRLKGK